MKEEKKGIFLGVMAYVLWGIIPLYWKLIPQVSAIDILCYRVIWSFCFMLIYMCVSKKIRPFMQEMYQLLQDKKNVSLLYVQLFLFQLIGLHLFIV